MAPRRRGLAQSALLLLGLLASADNTLAQCNSDNSVTFASEYGSTYCVCDSTYTGAQCNTNVTIQGDCEIRIPEAMLTYYDGKVEDVALGGPNGQDLVVIMSWPMVKSRKYPSFKIGTCSIEKFKTFQVTTPSPSSDCRDWWQFSIPWAVFAGGCGIENYLEVSKNATLYQRYNSDFSYEASDGITIGTGDFAIEEARKYTAQLPFVVDLQSSYSVTVGDDTPRLRIYSDFNITAAIISQDIVPGETTSSVDIGYVVYYPYQIVQFPTDLFVERNFGNVASATIVKDDGSPYPNTPNNAPVCNGNSTRGNGKGDYTVEGNGCFQKIKVRFVHGPACQVNATFTIPAMLVGCGAEIPAPDCPLTSATPKYATLTFNYGTDNICLNGNQTTVSIDGLVSVDRFIAVPTSNLRRDRASPTQIDQASWMYGEDMYMRMDFSGILDLQNVNLRQVQTDWSGNGKAFKLLYSSSKPPPTDMYSGYAAASTAGGRRQAPVPLGFSVSDQSYLIKHKVDDTFATAIDSSYAKNPDSSRTLKVMITVDVGYTAAAANRRRRREATGNSAAGSELPAQTIVKNPALLAAAVNPESNNDFNPDDGSNNTTAIVLGVVLGLVAVAALVGAGFFVWRKKRMSARNAATVGVVIGPGSQDGTSSPPDTEPELGSLAAMSTIAANPPASKQETFV